MHHMPGVNAASATRVKQAFTKLTVRAGVTSASPYPSKGRGITRAAQASRTQHGESRSKSKLPLSLYTLSPKLIILMLRACAS